MGKVVAASSPRARSASISARPAAGPSRIATATARFSSTTGEGSAAQQHVVERRRSAPSRWPRRSAPRRAPPRSRPAACRGRSGRDGSARSTSAVPSAICAAVPERAVLVLEQHEVAVRRGARRAARLVQQHQREQAHRLGLGQQLDEQAPEADRLAREVGARQRLARGRRVALVEHEVDDAQHRVEPLRQARRATAPGRGCARRGSSPWRARCAARSWARR